MSYNHSEMGYLFFLFIVYLLASVTKSINLRHAYYIMHIMLVIHENPDIH